MILYSVLILVTILIENEAKLKKFDSAPMSQDSIHTAAELAKLIHLVNREVVNEESLNEDNTNEDGANEDDVNEYEVIGDKRVEDSSKQSIDLDYIMIRNGDKNHASVLKRIMALIQSNYEATKAHRDPPGFRIHVISNPRVLEEYKKNLGSRLLVINNPRVLEEYKKNIREKSRDNNNDKRINFKDFILDLRRNAVFRLDSSSMEKSFKSRDIDDFKSTKNIPNSSENDQLVYFNTKKYFNDGMKKSGRVRNDNNKDKGHNVDYFDDDRKNTKKKGREFDDLKQDNAWDVITKKYDWDDNERKRKNKYNDNSPKYNKQDTTKKFKKENRDIDNDWNKKITKQEKYDDYENKKTKKDKFDDWDQKIAKPEKTFNDSPKNDRFIDKPKNKKWDRGEKKRDNLDDWDKKIANPEKSYDEWPKKEKFIDNPKKNKWDSSERQKPKKKIKDFDLSYEKPSKKDIKGFDSYEKPSKKVIKDLDSYEKPKRDKKSNNDWENTPYKMAFRTTRKRQKESAVDWDKAYAPKIPSYYSNPKPKSRNNYDGGGFFGRTPIPYVGKKGIYVDNN